MPNIRPENPRKRLQQALARRAVIDMIARRLQEMMGEQGPQRPMPPQHPQAVPQGPPPAGLFPGRGRPDFPQNPSVPPGDSLPPLFPGRGRPSFPQNPGNVAPPRNAPQVDQSEILRMLAPFLGKPMMMPEPGRDLGRIYE